MTTEEITFRVERTYEDYEILCMYINGECVDWEYMSWLPAEYRFDIDETKKKLLNRRESCMK
jgi:hypothetical protein